MNTTLLPSRHPLRRARWIWPAYQFESTNTYAEFRHDFQLAAVPKKAPLFITVDQQYVLYVNGTYAGRGPARGYQKTWPFDEIDVAPLLKKGRNWLAIKGYNAGVSTFQYVHQTMAGLLCAAEWGKTKIHSGEGWLIRTPEAYQVDTARLSIQINFQEAFDARLDDERWIYNAATPKQADGWETVGWCRAFGSMPWHSLQERGIPMQAGDIVPYRNVHSQATGNVAEGYDDVRNLYAPVFNEIKASSYTSADVVARSGKTGLSLTLPKAGKGKYVAACCDLGRPGFGTLEVHADGAAGGEIVDFFFCEATEDDGLTPATGRALVDGCGTSMVHRLTLAKGKTRHEYFQQIGHRYVVAIARDTARPIKLRLALRETVYPLEVRGKLETDNAEINDIHRICVQTQRVCMMDSYVDTPWREQAQWWGDARVQAMNTFHLADDTRLLVRGIRSLAGQEVPNGLTFGHAPTMAYTCILPDFSLIWAMTIWDYYWQSGDVSLFVEQWPRIERLLGYFTGEGCGRDGLLTYDDRYWLFLDWTDIHKDGTPTLLNLWYVLVLEKLATLAKLAEMPAEARRLAKMHREQAAQVIRKLWDKKVGLFHDGLKRNGKAVRTCSIHNQVLAMLAGLQPEHHPAMLAKRIVPYLKGRKIAGAHPGSYWVTYVYDVAEAAGYGREVIEHIRKYWRAMIPYEGCWEQFPRGLADDPYAFNLAGSSVTHAWAAHPIYHFARTLGGVTQIEPAWQKVRFAPVLSGAETDKAEVKIPTPRGMITSRWSRKDAETVSVSLALPKGVEAIIDLPGVKAQTVTGRNRWEVAVPADS